VRQERGSSVVAVWCDVSVGEAAGWPLVRVVGELDLATAPQARAAVIDAVGSDASRLVLDLSELAFVDSAGLGVIIGALRRVRSAGGELRVVAPPSGPRRVLALTGLDTLFTVVASVDEAVAPADA
jgi:anti-sigma B factor antagonist